MKIFTTRARSITKGAFVSVPSCDFVPFVVIFFFQRQTEADIRRSPSCGSAVLLVFHPLADEIRAESDPEITIFAVDQVEESKAIYFL